MAKLYFLLLVKLCFLFLPITHADSLSQWYWKYKDTGFVWSNLDKDWYWINSYCGFSTATNFTTGVTSTFIKATNNRKVKILIAYDTKTGHTEAFANSVYLGARQVQGVEVTLANISNIDPTQAEFKEYDGYIIGSPVYKAGMSGKLTLWFENWPLDPDFHKKIGAAFVTAGGISAGEETAQLDIIHAFLILNMIVIGGDHWRQPFGASQMPDNILLVPNLDHPIQNKAVEEYEKRGYALGERVARIAKLMDCAKGNM